jgi:hypothetical protein
MVVVMMVFSSFQSLLTAAFICKLYEMSTSPKCVVLAKIVTWSSLSTFM